MADELFPEALGEALGYRHRLIHGQKAYHGVAILSRLPLPGELEGQIGAFVGHYNHRRYHESLGNVMPADVYLGRDAAIIERREKIRKLTIQKRRLFHQRQTA